MSQDTGHNEWIALKNQFDELVRNERVPDDDISQAFDALARRRFGEAIYRAVVGASDARKY